jgi:hypothetical protein
MKIQVFWYKTLCRLVNVTDFRCNLLCGPWTTVKMQAVRSFEIFFSMALQPCAGDGLLVHEDSWSHTTTRHSQILRNNCGYLPINRASYPIRFESSSTRLWELHISLYDLWFILCLLGCGVLKPLPAYLGAAVRTPVGRKKHRSDCCKRN